MADLRHEANDYAQRAWTRVREHHTRTGHWSPVLEREYLSAEQMVRDVEAAEAMTEAQLDALHEATHADLDDLRDLDPQWLPDIPLAVIPFEWTPIAAVLAESELRLMDGNR